LPDELFNECIVRYVFEDHLHLYWAFWGKSSSFAIA
jgi:hypothetical protein